MSCLQNVQTSSSVGQTLYITPDAFNQLLGFGLINFFWFSLCISIIIISYFLIKKAKDGKNDQ